MTKPGTKSGTKTGLILGIIGGIFGILAALGAMLFGGLGVALGSESAGGQIIGLGFGAMVFSIIGLVGGVMSGDKPLIGGWMLVISGILVIIMISAFGILPGLLFLIGGGITLYRHYKK